MSEEKITILRRLAHHDLIEQYQHETVAPCDGFYDGQVFTITDWSQCPEKFCKWAWADLAPKIELAAHMGTVVACCTDAFRPVTFEIQRQVADL